MGSYPVNLFGEKKAQANGANNRVGKLVGIPRRPCNDTRIAGHITPSY